MRNQAITRLHMLAVAVLLALTAIGFVKIPATPGLAMHWGPDGHPDLLWPRNWALLLFPALTVVLLGWALLMGLRMASDDKVLPLLESVVLAGLGLLDAFQFGFILIGVGSDFDLFRVLGFVAGVVFLVLGVTGAGLRTDVRDPRRGPPDRAAGGLFRILLAVAGAGLLWAISRWSDPIDTLPAIVVAVLVPPIIAGLFKLVRRLSPR